MRLERVGAPRPAAAAAQDRERVTDGAVSPDGQRVVLRTHESLLFYEAAQFTKGDWQQEQRVDLGQLREPQGEGVTFGADGSIYLVGESGGGKQAGTFAHLVCKD